MTCARQTGGMISISEVGRVAKHIASQGCQTLRQMDSHEAVTAIESTVSNGYHSLAKIDINQCCTAIECFITNSSLCIGYYDSLD